MSRFSIITLILAWCFAICGLAWIKINCTIIIILAFSFIFTVAALFMVWWENKYIYGRKKMNEINEDNCVLDGEDLRNIHYIFNIFGLKYVADDRQQKVCEDLKILKQKINKLNDMAKKDKEVKI